MLNIISRYHLSRHASGCKKVVNNLIKGLKQIGYPFVVNQRLDACSRLWVFDDFAALRELKNLSSEIKVAVGPCLYVLPRLIPKDIDLSRAVLVHSSEGPKGFWTHFGFTSCPQAIWPAGIDTEEFKPSPAEKKYVLVYFKKRAKQELKTVIDVLAANSVDYKIIEYGRYSEEQFKESLAGARYMIWLGIAESQCVALGEALASGTPVLVCDVKNVGHRDAGPDEMNFFTEEEKNYEGVTSAPYFNETCGLKIKDLNRVSEAVAEMEKNWARFNPRQYVLDNLNLEKQARDFLRIYEESFGLKVENGFTEKAARHGKWRNDRWCYKTRYRLLDETKHILKKII